MEVPGTRHAFGARQVGKTTMVKQLLASHGSPRNYCNCDITSAAAIFENLEPVLLKRSIGSAQLIVIDEAQRVKNIGLTLKVLHDSMPDLQIITTGSSSFSLSDALNEPLTGRGIEFTLYSELPQNFPTQILITTNAHI